MPNETPFIEMTVEGLQTVLQSELENIEANAIIGVYNSHNQTLTICPYWECDFPEQLPILLAQMLTKFADTQGNGESIGAFAYREM